MLEQVSYKYDREPSFSSYYIVVRREVHTYLFWCCWRNSTWTSSVRKRPVLLTCRTMHSSVKPATMIHAISAALKCWRNAGRTEQENGCQYSVVRRKAAKQHDLLAYVEEGHSGQICRFPGWRKNDEHIMTSNTDEILMKPFYGWMDDYVSRPPRGVFWITLTDFSI